MFAPTWDLFILVFFAIIVAYSFIIGRNATMKITIATYLAILVADGIGNVASKLFFADRAIVSVLSGGAGDLAVLKIILFVIAIVLLTIRGGFVVEIREDASFTMNLATTAAFGFLSAGLIVSTILVYVTSGSFLAAAQASGVSLIGSSYLVRTMTENYAFWFSMPAIAFLVASFVGDGEAADPHGHAAVHGHEE